MIMLRDSRIRCIFFFFFKQKTAYEITHSDWSSDVCSSDLSAMVDGGAPFGARATVSDDGTSPAPSDQNGYTIVEAGSLDGARALTDGHPFLSEGKGRFTIEIFELVPM